MKWVESMQGRIYYLAFFSVVASVSNLSTFHTDCKDNKIIAFYAH